MAKLINGRRVAKRLNQKTKRSVMELVSHGVIPTLALIVLGNDSASLLYVHMKNRMAKRLRIRSFVNHLSGSITQKRLVRIIQAYDHNPKIDGILVQSPLPNQINESVVDSYIDPNKDVDGLNLVNVGRLSLNESGFYPVSCTSRGIMTLLKEYRIRLKDQKVVIIGTDQIVSRPLLNLMLNAGAVVSILRSDAQNVTDYTKFADVVISAVNRADSLIGSDLKPGCTVIDVGENHDVNGKLVGDVDFATANQVVGKITPVPGGVGPMTIATLMQQTVELCRFRHHVGRN